MSLLVDHPQQLVNLERFVQADATAWPGQVSALVKIDCGTHRAGVAPASETLKKIADARGDPMSRFHNALYAGDVLGRIAVLKDVGMCQYPTGRVLCGSRC